jgi:hypothetical protein
MPECPSQCPTLSNFGRGAKFSAQSPPIAWPKFSPHINSHKDTCGDHKKCKHAKRKDKKCHNQPVVTIMFTSAAVNSLEDNASGDVAVAVAVAVARRRSRVPPKRPYKKIQVDARIISHSVISNYDQ